MEVRQIRIYICSNFKGYQGRKRQKNPSKYTIGLLASTHLLALRNQGAFNTDPFIHIPEMNTLWVSTLIYLLYLHVL
jgi:hypothetical protein